MNARTLLITGPPGVGKTTVVQKIAASLAGWRLAGFYTEEIRDAGRRRGFRAVTFDGSVTTIAHERIGGPHRVGKYGVDISAIDALAAAALTATPSTDACLVDEIGKMECLSSVFVVAARRLLDGPTPFVATVGLRGGGFIAEVKRRSDVEVWKVTRANRDRVPQSAVARLRSVVESAG